MPKTDLHPIDPTSGVQVPFNVSEKVAFREDHPEHGNTQDSDGGIVAPAKYGIVQAIGLDAEGKLAFDLLVLDPFTGETGEVRRSTMEDIQ